MRKDSMSLFDLPEERQEPAIEEFWRRVELDDDEDQCWIWKGSVRHTNARFVYRPLDISARRFVIEAEKQERMDPRDQAFLTCGNHLCVNPNHIEVSTRKEWQDKQADKHYEEMLEDYKHELNGDPA